MRFINTTVSCLLSFCSFSRGHLGKWAGGGGREEYLRTQAAILFAAFGLRGHTLQYY